MGLFHNYIIFIKFKDGDEGYFVRVSGKKIIYNSSAKNARQYYTRFKANYDIGYWLSDFEDIIRYTEVLRY